MGPASERSAVSKNPGWSGAENDPLIRSRFNGATNDKACSRWRAKSLGVEIGSAESSTRESIRIYLRASDSLGRKEPQRHRDGNLPDLDSRRGHRHLAVRAATGQYSASRTGRRRLRRLRRRPSGAASSATSGSQRIDKSSHLAETW